MGAATVALTHLGDGRDPHGVDERGNRTILATVTASASYATGGDSIDLGALGLREVREAWILANTDSLNPLADVDEALVSVDVDDPTAPLLIVYDAPGTEEGNGTDTSGTVALIKFVGH